jgi:hypothetical protein
MVKDIRSVEGDQVTTRRYTSVSERRRKVEDAGGRGTEVGIQDFVP